MPASNAAAAAVADADLALLRDAAAAAGEVAMRHFRSDLETWEKGGGQGPVSEADLEIDRMLRAELTAARPGYGWLSEETADTAERLTAERVFIVDPIDGTRSFIAGQPTFAVSLAIVEAGAPVAACVFLPAREKLFEATSGGGARLNGGPIRAGGRKALEGAQALVTGGQLKSPLWRGGPPPVTRHFRTSLAYRLCLVAAGRFDVMLTLRDAWEWDIAAGALVATEAGAVVTDRRGAKLRFNSPGAMLSGVVAAGPALHAALMERL